MAIIAKQIKIIIIIIIINIMTTHVMGSIDPNPKNEQECLFKFRDFARLVPGDASKYCPPVYDKYLCWPPTKPSTTVQQFCPNIPHSDPTQYAFRRCGPDGLWEDFIVGNSSNTGWTNYSKCFENDTKYDVAVTSRYIELTGYAISGFAISNSLYIFHKHRSLRNIRTLIHKHVFYSMFSHTVICLVIYVDQIITRESIGVEIKDQNFKGIENTPNLCEVFYFLAEYTMSCIYTWVLVEGLHLNYLISNKALQPFNFKFYCAIAWIVPLVWTSIWAVTVWVSYRYDTVRVCWFGYNFAASYWILQGPRLAILLINAIIHVKILRAVIKKLKEAKTPENLRLKKSVKAALFLIPILGLTNLLTIFDVPIHSPTLVFMILSYCRQFIKSIQGLFLSLTYCLGNDEVRTIIMKGITRLFQNIDCFAKMRWIMPRQQVIDPLSLSPLDTTTPPTFEETTLSQDMRSSSVTQQPRVRNEISDNEGLPISRNQLPFVSETTFIDIALGRHIDYEDVDEIRCYTCESVNINEYPRRANRY